MLFGGKQVRSEYLSGDGRACRLSVILEQPALSNPAMATLAQLRRACLRALPAGFNLHLAGATAEMADVRSVTQRDFYRVAALTLAVVFLIVLALLRDAVLSGLMVASTVLSYLATLGATWWFFTALAGSSGLDWKVEVFLFVVMVAVGQDYNIFLAGRLAEESLRAPPRQAARAAIIHTGGVISSAGLIMAATLGSLASGDLALLVQLGFAFALGMLVDTFLVRPLLLPAAAVLTRRTGRALRRRG
jgi:RND superfamily putative drug exporter